MFMRNLVMPPGYTLVPFSCWDRVENVDTGATLRVFPASGTEKTHVCWYDSAKAGTGPASQTYYFDSEEEAHNYVNTILALGAL